MLRQLRDLKEGDDLFHQRYRVKLLRLSDFVRAFISDSKQPSLYLPYEPGEATFQSLLTISSNVGTLNIRNSDDYLRRPSFC
jgi:hypothetical protein